LIEDFGKIPGLRLNDKKTEAFWIGSKMICNQKFCPEKNFKWQKKTFSTLVFA